MIGAGRVRIDGMPAAKPATAVSVDANLTVIESDERTWVSRGAHKLIGALDAFGLSVEGRRCLDAGASTGGFTEVLLDRGAAEVVAADVGYGQLAWSLRSDPRVHVLERTNVRDLTPEAIGGPVQMIVADLSFISLATVLPALTACAVRDADIVPMVKPRVAHRCGVHGRAQGRRAAVACCRCDGQPASRALGQRGVLPEAARRDRFAAGGGRA